MTEKKTTIAFPVGPAPKPIPRACSDVFRLWAALGLGILLSLAFFILQDLYQEMGFRKQLTPAQIALEEDYGSNLVGWVGFVPTSFHISGSSSSIEGYFTQVIWKGLADDTGSVPDFGVRVITLVE